MEAHVLQTFWNLSNHSVETSWPETQKEAARTWGGGTRPLELEDVGFPLVDPDLDREGVAKLGEAALAALDARGPVPGEPVHVMGELTLTHALVLGLKARGLVPLASTTVREVTTMQGADGGLVKQSQFRFRRFRAY